MIGRVDNEQIDVNYFQKCKCACTIINLEVNSGIDVFKTLIICNAFIFLRAITYIVRHRFITKLEKFSRGNYFVIVISKFYFLPHTVHPKLHLTYLYAGKIYNVYSGINFMMKITCSVRYFSPWDMKNVIWGMVSGVGV